MAEYSILDLYKPSPNDSMGIAETLSSNFQKITDLFSGIFWSVKWSGAVGNFIDDDTQAFKDAIETCKQYGRSLYVPAGKYRLSDTLEIPRNMKVIGQFASSWQTFGQRRSVYADDNILDQNEGTILAFVGTPTLTYNTNRADFQNLRVAIKTAEDGDGVQISHLKVLCNFTQFKLDATTQTMKLTDDTTDDKALYDVGIWIENADNVDLNFVYAVGYWQKAGFLLDGSGRFSEMGEYGACEYVTLNRCLGQGYYGLAIVGSDEDNPPNYPDYTMPSGDASTEGQFGMSHIFIVNSFFSGYDHHGNGFTANWSTVNLKDGSAGVFIDGLVATGEPYRINGVRFMNTSIQTREMYSVYINRASRPQFVNCRAESGAVYVDHDNCQNPSFINCEWPYSRSDGDFNNIDTHPNSYNFPAMQRRLGHMYLKDYKFVIEFRNNGGSIEHRITKAHAISATARSFDAEAVFRYPIDRGWSYQAWTPTPVPTGTAVDDYSKGVWLGEKAFTNKYNIFTVIQPDNDVDYQEVTAEVLINESTQPDIHVEPVAISDSSGSIYRHPDYSTVLKLQLRNGTSPSGGLHTILPNESAGSPSLTILVSGKFYAPVYRA